MNIREEFEKLANISKNIDQYVFCDIDNQYKELDIRYTLGRIKINGAWYAYQESQKQVLERQKKIDAITLYMKELANNDNVLAQCIYDDLVQILEDGEYR